MRKTKMHLFITVTSRAAAENYAAGAKQVAGFVVRITRKGDLFNVWIQRKG